MDDICNQLGVCVGSLGLVYLGSILAGVAIKQVVNNPAILAVALPAIAYGAYFIKKNTDEQNSIGVSARSRSEGSSQPNQPKLSGKRKQTEDDEELARRLQEAELDHRAAAIRQVAAQVAAIDEALARLICNEEIVSIPSKIQTGTYGIQNQNDSCVIASFLYTFIGTEKLDTLFLVDKESDNRETKEIRQILRQIVKDLRSKQYVSGDLLGEFREKIISFSSDVEKIHENLGVNTNYLNMSDLLDCLKKKLGLNNEFIKISDEGENVQQIVETHLSKDNNLSTYVKSESRTQAVCVSLSSRDECDLSNAQEIKILGNEFELESVVVVQNDHATSYVRKNDDQWYYFDSSLPLVKEAKLPKEMKNAYLIYTRKE